MDGQTKNILIQHKQRLGELEELVEQLRNKIFMMEMAIAYLSVSVDVDGVKEMMTEDARKYRDYKERLVWYI